MDSIDAAELALSLPEVDPERPSPARIYDFWLGGSQNFEADREAGRRAADLREPGVVLDHPLVRDAIDWSRPVAVLLFSVLHFVPDDIRPQDIIRAFMAPCAPGSYLALSHGGPDDDAPEAQQAVVRDYASRTGVPVTPRTAAQITPWLAGLEIQAPGVEDIRVWLPSLTETHQTIVPFVGALARKPA